MFCHDWPESTDPSQIYAGSWISVVPGQRLKISYPGWNKNFPAEGKVLTCPDGQGTCAFYDRASHRSSLPGRALSGGWHLHCFSVCTTQIMSGLVFCSSCRKKSPYNASTSKPARASRCSISKGKTQCSRLGRLSFRSINFPSSPMNSQASTAEAVCVPAS